MSAWGPSHIDPVTHMPVWPTYERPAECMPRGRDPFDHYGADLDNGFIPSNVLFHTRGEPTSIVSCVSCEPIIPKIELLYVFRKPAERDPEEGWSRPLTKAEQKLRLSVEDGMFIPSWERRK